MKTILAQIVKKQVSRSGFFLSFLCAATITPASGESGPASSAIKVERPIYMALKFAEVRKKGTKKYDDKVLKPLTVKILADNKIDKSESLVLDLLEKGKVDFDYYYTDGNKKVTARFSGTVLPSGIDVVRSCDIDENISEMELVWRKGDLNLSKKWILRTSGNPKLRKELVTFLTEKYWQKWVSVRQTPSEWKNFSEFIYTNSFSPARLGHPPTGDMIRSITTEVIKNCDNRIKNGLIPRWTYNIYLESPKPKQ